MDRKEFLKRLGMLTVGASLIGVDVSAMTSEAAAEATAPADGGKAASKTHPDLDFDVRPLKAKTDRAITAIIIGAGPAGLCAAYTLLTESTAIMKEMTMTIRYCSAMTRRSL